jgi:hypothetical protein
MERKDVRFMKQFLALASLLAAISFTAQAHAQLGHNIAVCTKQYGRPVAHLKAAPPATRAVEFEKDGLCVTVHFVNDRAAVIGLAKKKGDLSEAEVKSLLPAYKARSEWGPVHISSLGSKWELVDKSAYALWSRGKLYIVSKEWTVASAK